MKTLLLIDLQNEWIEPKSEYYIGSNLLTFRQKLNLLIEFCRKNNYKIIFIQHIEENSGEAFSQNSSNSELFHDLNRDDKDLVIQKNMISPFYKTNLEDELKDSEEIVIAGILTNLCVRSAAQDSYDRDFSITIIENCCVAMDEATHNFTLKDLKETRPEINIISLEKFIN